MGRNTSQQARNALSAAQSGTAARQRATEALAAQSARGNQEGLQVGQAAAGTLQRQQGLDEQEAANRTREHQAQQRIQLQGKQAGYDIDPSQVQDPRQAALEQRMQQGNERLNAQMDKGLEVTGPNQAVVPSEEGLAKKAAEQDIKQQKVNLARQKEIRQLSENDRKYREAIVTKNEEGMEKAYKGRVAMIENTQGLLDRAMTGKLDANQTKNLMARYKDTPDAAARAEIESGMPGPAMQRLIRSDIAQQNLGLIAINGDLPPADTYDISHPLMTKFQEDVKTVRAQMKFIDSVTGGGQSAQLGLDSSAAANRRINKIAAAAMLEEQRMRESLIPAMQPMGQDGGGGGVATSEGPAAPEMGSLVDDQRVFGKQYDYRAGTDESGAAATDPVRQRHATRTDRAIGGAIAGGAPEDPLASVGRAAARRRNK